MLFFRTLRRPSGGESSLPRPVQPRLLPASSASLPDQPIHISYLWTHGFDAGRSNTRASGRGYDLEIETFWAL
jgi:hypothetical protein